MSSTKRKEVLRLERVLGLTSIASSSLSAAAGNHIIYCAGAIAIRYDTVSNSQKAFYKANRPLSCISVSPDGMYLAAGERGHMPSVRIWDLSSGEQIATLTGHTHGVGSLAFSPDSRYLVTVGFKLDKQLFLWDWKENLVISAQKVVSLMQSFPSRIIHNTYLYL
jgi:WD40 repeat protein